jgi:glycosyltransferase involved in cell wall biosynthesis
MRVLHLVATGKRRGAEIFASDLIGALNRAGVTQRVAVIRGGTMDVSFDAPCAPLDGVRKADRSARMRPRSLWRLRRLVEAWRPDVVQVHGGEALKYGIPSLLGIRIPLVYRRIGLAPRWLDHGPRRAVYGWLMRRSARVVVVADELRRETERLFGVPTGRVHVIPNGVDVTRLGPTVARRDARLSLGMPVDRPVIASVGGLTWEKDPLAHLRIATRVFRRSDAIHVWAGDGPMRSALEREAQRQRLDGRLVLLGSRSDVGTVLAAADVFLFASRPDGMEGMPAALIEAGMAGLPAAGFAVAGVPEVVVNGKTGLLVRPGDEEALAAGVVELLEDETRRRSVGAAARERCLAEFEIEPIAERYLSLYDEVCGR